MAYKFLKPVSTTPPPTRATPTPAPPLTATKEDLEYALDAFSKSVEYVYGLSKN